MRLKIGNTYRGWMHDGAKRIHEEAMFHFKIIAKVEKGYKQEPLWLGVKMGVDYSAKVNEGSLYWFDESGINDCGYGVTFKLKRKIPAVKWWPSLELKDERQ